MQYENWEFDLEPIPDKYKGRDSYKYIGKEKFYYYGLEVKEIELTFELDILVEVRLYKHSTLNLLKTILFQIIIM